MLNGILLDIVQSDAVPASEQSMSLWDLIIKGGPLMIPIFILSVIAIFIFIERYLTVGAASRGSKDFMRQVRDHVKTGNVEAAKSLCENTNNPMSRMVAKGLQRIGASMKDIEGSIENVGRIEINKLEKNISALATISGAAPMIGFLGTVIGMINTFMKLSGDHEASNSELAKGIYVALVTTVGGLIVGIIAYIAYNYLTAMITKIVHRLEYTAVEFIDLLHEPQSS